jgi:hypothetical protein
VLFVFLVADPFVPFVFFVAAFVPFVFLVAEPFVANLRALRG